MYLERISLPMSVLRRLILHSLPLLYIKNADGEQIMTTVHMAGARTLDDLAGEAAQRALELRGLTAKGARARKKKALIDFMHALEQAGASAKRSTVPVAERSVHAWFCQVRASARHPHRL